MFLEKGEKLYKEQVLEKFRDSIVFSRMIERYLEANYCMGELYDMLDLLKQGEIMKECFEAWMEEEPEQLADYLNIEYKKD